MAESRTTTTTLLHHLLTTHTNSPINTISLLLNRRIMIQSSSSSSQSLMEGQDSVSEEENDWAYSKPVIVVDVIWNLAFVFVSIVVMVMNMKECPSTPIRVWITGYSLQCLLHVGFVYVENRQRWWRWEGLNGGGDEEDLAVEMRRSVERGRGSRATSVVKKLETVNTVVSFLWWMVGFYWIVMGGQALLQDAPRLYWLAVVFLAFDVFFAIFCVVLACMIGIAICCCLPCIIVMLYSMVSREGASEDDIKILPRYKFHQTVEPLLPEREMKHNVALMKMESNGDSITEISLPPDDSECCICLSKYVDGVELHSLPCNHYFHSGCIVKWLRINAKCPLCKYNILDDELV
ncbi:hypothetical protein ACHQM5_018563 [Ranunculus cassubicifolius]